MTKYFLLISLIVVSVGCSAKSSADKNTGRANNINSSNLPTPITKFPPSPAKTPDTNKSKGEGKLKMNEDNENFLETSWKGIEKALQTEFVTVSTQEELPELPHQDSERWCGGFFQNQANPYNLSGGVRYSFNLPTDTLTVLQLNYQIEGMNLTLLDSANITILLVDIQGLPISSESVDEIANSLLRVKYEKSEFDKITKDEDLLWKFQYPAEKLAEGARFAFHPETDPTSMDSWRSRVDGGIRGGKLYFIFYKRNLHSQRMDLRNPSWQYEDFKTAWENAKAKQKGN